MEDDFERLSVSSEHDETSHTSVEGFGGLVGSLFQEFESLGLIEEIKESFLHVVISFWVSSRFLFGLSVGFFLQNITIKNYHFEIFVH